MALGVPPSSRIRAWISSTFLSVHRRLYWHRCYLEREEFMGTFPGQGSTMSCLIITGKHRCSRLRSFPAHLEASRGSGASGELSLLGSGWFCFPEGGFNLGEAPGFCGGGNLRGILFWPVGAGQRAVQWTTSQQSQPPFPHPKYPK